MDINISAQVQFTLMESETWFAIQTLLNSFLSMRIAIVNIFSESNSTEDGRLVSDDHLTGLSLPNLKNITKR